MTGAASRAITVLMAAFPVLLFLRFGLLSGKPTPQSAGGSTTSPALITYMGCSFTTCWRDPFRAHFPSKYGNPCRNAESELMSYRGRKFLLNKTANLLINSVREKGNWEGCQVVGQKVMFSWKYRDEIYSLQILLSRTQAGPGRTVKQQQEETSPNHVQKINRISV